jgi:tetratricopeptide (TPR) repeat protein
MGDYKSAMRDLNDALNIDSTDNKANSYMGIAYSQTGNIDQAIRHLKKAINRSKSDYYSNYILGRIYLSKNMFADAVKSFSDAFEYCPDDKIASQILMLKGGAHARLGNLNYAINDLDQAIKLSPDNALLYLERGKMLLESGSNIQAKSSLLEAEKLGSQEASELLKQLN